MRFIRKLIFWSSLVFIFLILTAVILLHVLPIEFASDNDENFFDALYFLGLPATILLTLTGTIKSGDIKAAIGGKIFITIFIALLPVAFAVATALSGICRWATEKILYENKKDPTSEIALRSFGCGAVDSGSPDYDVFKITYYTSHLIYITDIDTTKLDKTVWMQVTTEGK